MTDTKYQGHALDEITVDGEFKEARQAAAMAGCTGSRGITETRERRMADGTLKVESSITVEAIEQMTDVVNRKFGVWSWGPAYRVKGLDVVIVLAGREGRYKSHTARKCGYCGARDCGNIGRGQHHWVAS
jgi:hypothetical protein